MVPNHAPLQATISGRLDKCFSSCQKCVKGLQTTANVRRLTLVAHLKSAPRFQTHEESMQLEQTLGQSGGGAGAREQEHEITKTVIVDLKD